MTAPHYNEMVQEALAILTAHGCKPIVERGRRTRHIKIWWWDRSGRKRLFIAPRSPSDYRARHNARALLHRLIRQGEKR